MRAAAMRGGSLAGRELLGGCVLSTMQTTTWSEARR